MPKAAATIAAATDVLPLNRIASKLTELLGSQLPWRTYEMTIPASGDMDEASSVSAVR